MANPARLLHDLFERWLRAKDAKSAEFSVRGLGSDADDRDDQFEAHRLAMVHLTQVNRFLLGLESRGLQTSHYRRGYRAWRSWVLNYPFSWERPTPQDNRDINQDKLDILAGLAERIDSESREFSEEDRQSLDAAIGEARDLLIEDESLNTSLKRHLHALIAEADQCLADYRRSGDFSLQSALDSLVIATNMAKHDTKDEAARGRWADLRDRFVYPVSVLLAVDGVRAALELPSAQ